MRMLVTPTVAADWLKGNKNKGPNSNRPLDQMRIMRLAQTILNGEWVYNGESIKRSKKGWLLDGQHRLLAIIQSGVAVESEVIEGLPESVFATLDQGKSRTASDVLSMTGHEDPKYLAAAIRLILVRKAGPATSWTMKFPNPQVMDVAIKEPRIEELVVQCKPAVRICYPSPLAMVGYFATETSGNKTQWKAFVDGLASGESLRKGDPRLVARDKLTTGLKVPEHYGAMSRATAAIVAAGWNAFVSGEKLTGISYNKTTRGAIIVPEIVGERKRRVLEAA